MTIREYGEKAITTAMHETRLDTLVECALSLLDEWEEYDEKVKPLELYQVDKTTLYYTFPDELTRKLAIAEIGDIVWGIGVMCEILNITPDVVSVEPSRWHIYYISLIQGRVKKTVRQHKYEEMPEAFKEVILDALNNLLWYIIEECKYLQVSLEEVMQMNLDKLFDRKARDVIKGDGDIR